MSSKVSHLDDKPEYGLYVGYSIIAISVVFGTIGLVLIILGFYVRYFLNLFLWIVGAMLAILFLWLAVGSSLSNIESEKQDRARNHSFDFLKEFDKPQILDCGCGSGRHAIPLAKQMPKGAFLTGIDIFDPKSISINSLERVQKNAELEGVAERTNFKVGSVTEIPFENDKFDVVTCMGVFHELRGPNDKQKAFREICRVLKPDGVFYLSELNRVSMIPYMGLFGLYLKNKPYWEEQLTRNKFKIIRSNIRGSLIEFITKKS